jgi:hypothetical protein
MDSPVEQVIQHQTENDRANSEEWKYVPSMYRKRSLDGRRSRLLGRDSGGMHQKIETTFQRESFQSDSAHKGEMT